MLVFDVNVLLACFRGDHPQHEAVYPWWRSILDEETSFHVPDTVWVGLVRIATNRRIFPVPASVDEVFEFVAAVRQQPGYRTGAGDPDVIEEWARCCRQGQAAADLVPDAYIAACAVRLGATVVTWDRDFRRFDGLRLLDPTRP